MPTKTADEVVRLALEAQGGLESWQRVAFVTATVDLNGVVWGVSATPTRMRSRPTTGSRRSI